MIEGRRIEGGMIADECTAIMVERIVRDFGPLKILLFGSRARGDAKPDSDIDLIVVLPSVADAYALAAEVRGSLSGIGFAKDVIVTTPEEIERGQSLPGHVLRHAIPEPCAPHECAAREVASPPENWGGVS